MSRNDLNRPVSASADKIKYKKPFAADFRQISPTVEVKKPTVVVCTWHKPLTQLIYMKTITTTRRKVQTWLDYSHNYPNLVVMTAPPEYIQSLEGNNIPNFQGYQVDTMILL